MSLPLPPSTPMTKKYMRSFWLRLIVFLFVVVAYVMKSSELDFTTHDQFVSELSLLWLAMLVSMLSQLNPNSALTTGCHKQHSTHFEPVPDYDPQQLAQALRREQRGAMRVAAVWLAIRRVVSQRGAGRSRAGFTQRSGLLVRFGLRAVLLPVSNLFDEKPLLCQLPHLRVGQLDDGRPADACPPLVRPVPVLGWRAGYGGLGGAAAPPPRALLGGL